MSDKLPNVHPGEVLLEDFMKPLGITAYRLSKDIGVQQTRVGEIIRGVRGITPDTALRLSKYLGTSPDVWLNMQRRYDLEAVKDLDDSAAYAGIKPFDPASSIKRRKAA